MIRTREQILIWLLMTVASMLTEDNDVKKELHNIAVAIRTLRES